MTLADIQVLIKNTLSTNPGFFFYFMIFMKLEEMRIIDKALFYHLNGSIVYYENELNAYIIELLNHFKLS